ncbi:MAG: hypothetical protein ABSC14_11385 [Desulfomonilia bacterium]|jgi:hypothetical protein
MTNEESCDFSECPLDGIVRAIEPEGDISPAGLADICGHQFVGVAYLK